MGPVAEPVADVTVAVVPAVPPPAEPPPVELPPPVEPPPVEPPPPIDPDPVPVPPPPPPPEPPPDVVTASEVPAGAAAAAARKEDVVVAASGFESAAAKSDGSRIGRTFVIMGGVASKAVRSMGMPFFLLIGLGLLVATLGNVGIFPLIGRSRRMTGTVVGFDEESGYGFILAEELGSQVFVHRHTLSRRSPQLAAGQRVSFRVINGSHRDFALAVRKVDS